MMKKRGYAIVITCLMALLNLTCLNSCRNELTLGQERVIEKSHKNPPKWVKFPPEKTRKAYFFVGEDISSNKTDRYAYQVALSKAGSFISTQASSIYKRSEESLNAYDSAVLREEYIKNISDSAIKGAHLDEVYWEKVEKLTEKGIQYTYRISALISISTDAVKASQEATLQMQLEKAKKENKKKVVDLLSSIKTDLDKNFQEASQ